MPTVPGQAGSSDVPGPRPRDLPSLLRHQAGVRDSLPRDLRLSLQLPRAPAGASPAPAGGRHRDTGAWHDGPLEPRQQLYLFTLTLFERFRGDGLDAALDADVISALEALAATYDTASRGLIYEQQAATAPAQRLAAGIRGVFDELGHGRPSGFAADAAEVLRRLANRARSVSADSPRSTRAFLDLAARVARRFGSPDAAPADPGAQAAQTPSGSGLILP